MRGGAGLLTGAVRGRSRPGSFSQTPKPFSAQVGWRQGGWFGTCLWPQPWPLCFSKWQLFGRWRPPTAPAPQSTLSSAPAAPLLGAPKRSLPGVDTRVLRRALPASALPCWVVGGPVSVGLVAAPSLSSGRAWGAVAAVPRESLCGLPLAWGLVGGLHLGRSPGRKRLPPRGLPVPH